MAVCLELSASVGSRSSSEGPEADRWTNHLSAVRGQEGRDTPLRNDLPRVCHRLGFGTTGPLHSPFRKPTPMVGVRVLSSRGPFTWYLLSIPDACGFSLGRCLVFCYRVLSQQLQAWVLDGQLYDSPKGEFFISGWDFTMSSSYLELQSHARAAGSSMLAGRRHAGLSAFSPGSRLYTAVLVLVHCSLFYLKAVHFPSLLLLLSMTSTANLQTPGQPGHILEHSAVEQFLT